VPDVPDVPVVPDVPDVRCAAPFPLLKANSRVGSEEDQDPNAPTKTRRAAHDASRACFAKRFAKVSGVGKTPHAPVRTNDQEARAETPTHATCVAMSVRAESYVGSVPPAPSAKNATEALRLRLSAAACVVASRGARAVMTRGSPSPLPSLKRENGQFPNKEQRTSAYTGPFSRSARTIFARVCKKKRRRARRRRRRAARLTRARPTRRSVAKASFSFSLSFFLLAGSVSSASRTSASYAEDGAEVSRLSAALSSSKPSSINTLFAALKSSRKSPAPGANNGMSV
jgi:hypothetical protein